VNKAWEKFLLPVNKGTESFAPIELTMNLSTYLTAKSHTQS